MPDQPLWTKKRFIRNLITAHYDENSSAWILNPTFTAHALLGAGLIGLSGALYGVAFSKTEQLGNQWKICPAFTADQNQGQQLPSLTATNASIDRLGTSPPADGKPPVRPSQKERLKEQLLQLQSAQLSSCSAGTFFFANRNAALTVATGAGILAVASLAFVSKKGWEGSNNSIINIGVTSGFVLFTAWTFSQLYGQGINFETYKIKYSLATSLINAIASAAANQSAIAIAAAGSVPPSPLDLNKAADMTSLILRLDGQLDVINSPDFSGDTSFLNQAIEKISPILNLKPGAQVIPPAPAATPNTAPNRP